MSLPQQKGFTIVELLIVVVVIAILATVSVATFSGIQERSRVSQASSDMNQLYKAILAARINTGKTLFGVTGNNCTQCTSTAPYSQTLDRISEASGMDLSDLKAGDPWGNEYRIDENEGEQSANPCRRDGFGVLNHPEITSSGKFLIQFSLPECL